MIRAEVQKTLLREIFSLVFFFNDSYFNSQNHIMGIIAHDRTGGFMVPPSFIFCGCYIQTEKALLNKYFTKKDRFHTNKGRRQNSVAAAYIFISRLQPNYIRKATNNC